MAWARRLFPEPLAPTTATSSPDESVGLGRKWQEAVSGPTGHGIDKGQERCSTSRMGRSIAASLLVDAGGIQQLS